MKINLIATHQLLLTLFLLLFATTPAPAATAQSEDESCEELELMFEAMEYVAIEIGVDSEELFSGLAHGLSCAQVAIAHQSRPGDLIESLACFEESYILDMLLEKEISREEAVAWREENWIDITWLLHEEDPFGLADVMWLLDATCEETELELLELIDWMEEGDSIADIAEFMEVDLEDVREVALELLEMELDQLVVLEEIDDQEAVEWQTWLEEDLNAMFHDEDLLETLAEELWLEESIMEMAELLQLDEEELWTAVEEGESLQQLIEDADIEIAELLEEFGAEELEELLHYLDEDEGDTNDSAAGAEEDGERHHF